MTKVLTYHRGTYLNEALENPVFEEFPFLKGFIPSGVTGEFNLFDFRETNDEDCLRNEIYRKTEGHHLPYVGDVDGNRICVWVGEFDQNEEDTEWNPSNVWHSVTIEIRRDPS